MFALLIEFSANIVKCEERECDCTASLKKCTYYNQKNGREKYSRIDIYFRHVMIERRFCRSDSAQN